MRLEERLPGRGVLIVGHPGHELRVHHWLELARPTVHVVTDGSGRTGRSRLPSTAAVLERTGATPGAVFGRCTDADVYGLLLAGDARKADAIVDALADALTDADYVVGDALEGFNPSHDLCRLMVNAAVSRVKERTGRAVGNYDVLLEGDPRACPPELRAESVDITLNDADLSRKIAAALGYPELRSETERALATFGADAFRVEVLRPVRDLRQGVERLAEEPPYYEQYGERQVNAGHYHAVVRYHAHMRPIARALWRDVPVD